MKYSTIILILLIFSCSSDNKNIIGKWIGDENNLVISDSTFTFYYPESNTKIKGIRGSYRIIGRTSLEFNYQEYKDESETWNPFENLTSQKENYEIIQFELRENYLEITPSNEKTYFYVLQQP